MKETIIEVFIYAVIIGISVWLTILIAQADIPLWAKFLLLG